MAFLPFLAAGLGLGGSAISAFGKDKKKEQFKQVPTMTPEQQAIINQLLGGLGGPGGALGQGTNYLSQLLSGSPEAYKDFEAPYLRQFNEETIPGLAERFAGLGAGSQSSSAFQQALGQAGAGLQENLASLRGNLRMNALSQLQGLLGQGLRPSFENAYLPAQQSGWQKFGQALSPLAGAGLGGLFQFGADQRADKRVDKFQKQQQQQQGMQ